MITRVPVGHPDAVAVLREYFDDIVSRYHGRPATAEEIDKAQADEPSEHIAPFFVAREGDQVVGCVGVHLAEPAAELTRMFVKASARGRGWASRLLRAAEDAAREAGARAMRLDTRRDLVEARALYARRGYREVEPYGERRYADHYFEKAL
ncbi:GNAT family N-acetyltransferase [Amycolatopsis alkalitolerans]|uniref:GNAT family N-acetyltransferase n=1 Tax=Amycolatopsis alkalitolerans TaxID=2547244 RepID=A0A5C4LZZ3_9PSEU|nr:GNAT family N-acetyltransferase [Amycolatopsis alkalitolerans]TNC24530.1 GNAT family N-acetyltransferase [Amycolatopsis alkalitolerans]